MIFNRDFIDFIQSLNAQKVKYVLVGGLAVVVHGHFRTTKDMDIFYEPSESNAINILNAIDEFGFAYLKLTTNDLLDKNGYIKLGREPNRIDLFCDLPGVAFDDVYEQAIDFEEEELKFKVIHINHLIANKEKVGRMQDKIDVKNLKKIIEKRKNKK
ncbi:MAG: nucleotidyltransferase [Niabella sp.]